MALTSWACLAIGLGGTLLFFVELAAAFWPGARAYAPWPAGKLEPAMWVSILVAGALLAYAQMPAVSQTFPFFPFGHGRAVNPAACLVLLFALILNLLAVAGLTFLPSLGAAAAQGQGAGREGRAMTVLVGWALLAFGVMETLLFVLALSASSWPGPQVYALLLAGVLEPASWVSILVAAAFLAYARMPAVAEACPSFPFGRGRKVNLGLCMVLLAALAVNLLPVAGITLLPVLPDTAPKG